MRMRLQLAAPQGSQSWFGAAPRHFVFLPQPPGPPVPRSREHSKGPKPRGPYTVKRSAEMAFRSRSWRTAAPGKVTARCAAKAAQVVAEGRLVEDQDR